MRKKTIKRFAALVLSLVMMFAMGISSFAATGEQDYTRAKLSKQDQAILRTLFDADWYRATYTDVVEMMGDSDEVLFTHFLTHGMWETRQPSKNFNVNAYYVSYKDLQDATKDMSEAERVKALFLHYATTGKDVDKREYTTINKALEIVPKVTYVGSFHNEEVEKSQYGDILAQRETATSTLIGPEMLALMNEYYAKFKTFFLTPSNKLTAYQDSTIYGFPGFDTYDTYPNGTAKVRSFSKLLSAVFMLSDDSAGSYPNYLAKSDYTVGEETEADACGSALGALFDEYWAKYETIMNKTYPDFWDDASYGERVVDLPYTDWKALVAALLDTEMDSTAKEAIAAQNLGAYALYLCRNIYVS